MATLTSIYPISNKRKKLFHDTTTERTHLPTILMNALDQLQNDPNIIIKPVDKDTDTFPQLYVKSNHSVESKLSIIYSQTRNKGY